MNRSSHRSANKVQRQLLRIGMMMAITCLLSMKLAGQVVLISSDKKPKDPAPNTWWWSPKQQKLEAYWNGQWKEPYGKQYTQPYRVWAYHDLIIVEASKNHLYEVNGNLIEYAFDTIIPYDSLLFVRYRNTDMVIDARCRLNQQDRLRNHRRTFMKIEPQQVGGRTGFCILENLPETPYWVIGDACRFWGFLGSNGEWIIPPIFDEPFVFQNGVAKVKRYGAEFTVNEAGEIVD